MKNCVKAFLVFLSVASLLSCFLFSTNEDGSSTVWYVRADASDGNGSSWASAYSHPQAAMDRAHSGDTVKVAKGAYYLRSTADPDIPVLDMKEGVSVLGGYPREGGPDEDRDPEENETILIAAVYEGYSMVFQGRHVVMGASDAVLDGFTIMEGSAWITPGTIGSIGEGVSISMAPWGGGVLVREENNFVLSHCTIGPNWAEAGGAGIMCYNSTVLISKCYIATNNSIREESEGDDSPELYGGGICVYGGELSLVNSILAYNDAGDGRREGFGGGLAAISGGDVNILNCTFSDNFALNGLSIHDDGNDGGVTKVENSILWRNRISDGSVHIDHATAIAVSYSDVQMATDDDDVYPGTKNINQDPEFEGSFYHLKENKSPCINKVPSNLAPEDDIYDYLRDQDGDGSVQMGAVEELY